MTPAGPTLCTGRPEESMSQSNGRNGWSRQLAVVEEATILRRHFADKVPMSELCDEYHFLAMVDDCCTDGR